VPIAGAFTKKRDYPLVIVNGAFRSKPANDSKRLHLLIESSFDKVIAPRVALPAIFVANTQSETVMDPYAKPKERKVGVRRPKIRHVPQFVEPRTGRDREAEKQGVADERRAIKKAARRHLKEHLLRELEETD
jgi:hypothetical protein